MTSDWRWAALLLGIFGALAAGSARKESATYDEPINLLAGAVAWQTGDIAIDIPNPPLAHYRETLPYLLLHFHAFPPHDQLAQT